jgi:hypothetical protein
MEMREAHVKTCACRASGAGRPWPSCSWNQGLAAYLHDGRLLTLADTVEYFNLLLGLKLTRQEKDSLVTYMLALIS